MVDRGASDPTIYLVRSEPDPDSEYHCDALASLLPDARTVDFVNGDRVPLADADGVVLSGSTAGVYEADERPWIRDQEALVRELVERSIPTLGVCFGHQVVNTALGGSVEAVGTTAGVVKATLEDDPLFAGVSPVVVAIHGDVVTTVGADLTVIASAEHAPVFATRHRDAPLWTVQFHPEITATHRDLLTERFDWDERAWCLEETTHGRVVENFRGLVADRL